MVGVRARVVAALLAAAVLLGGCTARPAAPVAAPAPPVSTLDPSAGVSQPRADPLYPDYGNASLDVLSYQLALSWSPAVRVLTGTAILRIRPTVDVTELALDFAGSYTVDNSTVDGVSARSSRRGNDVVVPAGRTLARDSRTTLIVHYHGTPAAIPFPSHRSDADEGLGLRVVNDGELWTMQEPYGASTWYPVNDHPSDEATYDIAVTVPAGWSAIASGTPAEVTTTATGVTYRYLSPTPVASYATTLAVGHYTKLTATGPQRTPLTYWLRTGQDEAFGPAAADMPELLAWLSARFGPYPFPTAGVVFVDSDSAMETQQMVTYGTKVRGSRPDTRQTEEILLHELSHQWFGDAVTPADWLGLWLNEGWAMYAEWMWSVEQGLRTEDAWLKFAVDADSSSRKAAGPAGHPRPGHFGEDNVYLGPALMLREIRHQVGDPAFFALARDWVQTQRDQSVDRAGFIAFVNQHTGHDFTALINTWLDSPTTPSV